MGVGLAAFLCSWLDDRSFLSVVVLVLFGVIGRRYIFEVVVGGVRSGVSTTLRCRCAIGIECREQSVLHFSLLAAVGGLSEIVSQIVLVLATAPLRLTSFAHQILFLSQVDIEVLTMIVAAIGERVRLQGIFSISSLKALILKSGLQLFSCYHLCCNCLN